MTFNDFLNTDNEQFAEISSFYLEYLIEFSANNFPYDKQIQLQGIAGKFLNSIDKISYTTDEKKEKYLAEINNLIGELRIYRKIKNRSGMTSWFFPRQNQIINVQDNFQKIYSSSIEMINEANKIREYSANDINLNGLFNPKNSNKERIKELILDAIGLVQSDHSITEKTKNEIVEYLLKIIKRLDSNYTSWSTILGNISEISIILGALGSFVGGLSPLLQAKEKLEETNSVIQKTSVNINYNTINQTFNIHKIDQLQSISPRNLLENDENKKE